MYGCIWKGKMRWEKWWGEGWDLEWNIDWGINVVDRTPNKAVVVHHIAVNPCAKHRYSFQFNYGKICFNRCNVPTPPLACRPLSISLSVALFLCTVICLCWMHTVKQIVYYGSKRYVIRWQIEKHKRALIKRSARSIDAKQTEMISPGSWSNFGQH